MADRPTIKVVGDRNISSNNSTFNNVANTYHIYPQDPRLESSVSFDALLNSKARYPAPKCHPATRKLAQKVVKNWLCRKGEGSKKGIFWMSGAPGVGKSAIAQTVCEELCGDDGSMSWLSRIVLRIRTSYRTAIDNAIEKRPEILSEDFASQFRQLLTKTAQTNGFLQGPITVVIDGLDECNSDSDQVRLLELVLEAVKAGNMRFFIASRPEQHIHAFFHRQDASQHTWQVRLDEETFHTSQNIKVFLREEFARIRQERPEVCIRLPNGQEWPGDYVLDDLTTKSDSQFMFPILAIGFIDTPFFPPDKQLQILLAAPPSHAFSALDALYHTILSRRPPVEHLRGEDDLREYQEVVLGVLRVIIAWSGRPLSAAQIAMFLDKPVDVVQTIVRGPMRALFKFHTPNLDSPITLCHKSLRDYLLDQKRSGQFFIPSAIEDDLFVTVLTLPASSYTLHPTPPGILMDVLAAYPWGPFWSRWTVLHYATFLNVDTVIVEQIVISGPTSVLFDVDEDEVEVFSSSLDDFLRDENRSGDLFIPAKQRDDLAIRFLSRLTPPDSPYTYSRNLVLDILSVVGCQYSTISIPQIAAFLDVSTSVVEHIVKTGASRILFQEVGNDGEVGLFCPKLTEFLYDPDRSAEFFLSASGSRLDPFFSRIISLQPLPDPSSLSSHETLMSVVTVMVTLGKILTVEEIAFVLNVDDTVVERVIKFGTVYSLLRVTTEGLKFSTYVFQDYLENATRSGAFYISSTKRDDIYTRILSRHPTFPSSYSYHPSVLKDILAAVLWLWSDQRTVRHIAAFLKVDCNLVEHVVKMGAVKWLFKVEKDGTVQFSHRQIKPFLEDANRSGEFFVPKERLDPIFTRILSHPPHSSLPLDSREILMGVMAAIVAFEGNLTIEEIASLVNVDDPVVEGVVQLQPANVLFSMRPRGRGICFAIPLLETFLRDAARSEDFFLSQSSIDALFIRILSRGLASSSHLHSQNVLMDVLTIFMCNPRPPTIHEITSVIDSVDPTTVLGIFYGPAQGLFREMELCSPSLESFLKDRNRSGAFCIGERRIDALFTRILSCRPPAKPLLSRSRRHLMSVLTVMVSLPKELTAHRIASALEIDPDVITRYVRLDLLSWFFIQEWFHGVRHPFTDFLLNADWSGDLFVSPRRIDALFTHILSRQPPPDPSFAYSRDVLIDVLATIINSPEYYYGSTSWSVSRLSAFLDVRPTLIDGVVNVGPSRLFFHTPNHLLILSAPLLVPFLKDANRSGEFFISNRRLDPFFSRILSSWTPPSPVGSSSYHSRDTAILKDVLTITLVVPRGLSVLEAAAVLDISPTLVESVVQVGPTMPLFTYVRGANKYFQYFFSTLSLESFLRDAERSGDFYISDAEIDALFIRILSHPPPSHFPIPTLFKDVLRSVMAVIMASPEPLTMPQISALLDIDNSVVEAVVKAVQPANVLFDVRRYMGNVFIAPLLVSFLCDAHRSGDFFIPPTMTLDEIPKPWLEPLFNPIETFSTASEAVV